MRLLDRLDSEKVSGKLKSNQLLENERPVFEKIKSMCTEENKDENESRVLHNAFGSNASRLYSLYKLENGTHVILSKNGNDMLCYTGEVTGHGYITGAIIKINTRDNDISHVSYKYGDLDFTNNVKTEEIASVTKNGTMSCLSSTNFRREEGKIVGYRKNQKTAMDGKTIIDIIQQNINSEDDCDRYIGDMILSDFSLILNLVPERELKEESDVEISLRKANDELKEKTHENASLKSEKKALENKNATLESENEKLNEENRNLKRRSEELMQKLKQIREFICVKCSKIPFVGKRIVKEMNDTLGEKELPEGR